MSDLSHTAPAPPAAPAEAVPPMPRAEDLLAAKAVGMTYVQWRATQRARNFEFSNFENSAERRGAVDQADEFPDDDETEHQEQSALFQWADLAKEQRPELGLLFAIPNFAGRIGRLTAIHGAKLKREGRKKGVPDVMLPVPRGQYHGLFVEMKRVRGGSTSAEQRAWLAALRDMGYRAERCKGWEHARQVILNYLAPNAPAPAGDRRLTAAANRPIDG